MTMHTEVFCNTLDAMDREAALGALEAGLAALRRLGPRKVVDGMTYDNAPAIASADAVVAEDGADPVRLVRAVHEAYMQLSAIDDPADADALASLSATMADAGHPGFDAPSPRMR